VRGSLGQRKAVWAVCCVVDGVGGGLRQRKALVARATNKKSKVYPSPKNPSLYTSMSVTVVTAATPTTPTPATPSAPTITIKSDVALRCPSGDTYLVEGHTNLFGHRQVHLSSTIDEDRDQTFLVPQEASLPVITKLIELLSARLSYSIPGQARCHLLPRSSKIAYPKGVKAIYSLVFLPEKDASGFVHFALETDEHVHTVSLPLEHCISVSWENVARNVIQRYINSSVLHHHSKDLKYVTCSWNFNRFTRPAELIIYWKGDLTINSADDPDTKDAKLCTLCHDSFLYDADDQAFGFTVNSKISMTNQDLAAPGGLGLFLRALDYHAFEAMLFGNN
jgi:hypothetical protein